MRNSCKGFGSFNAKNEHIYFFSVFFLRIFSFELLITLITLIVAVMFSVFVLLSCGFVMFVYFKFYFYQESNLYVVFIYNEIFFQSSTGMGLQMLEKFEMFNFILYFVFSR